MIDSNFLRDMQAVILDMDGVLWRGETPLPGLVPFFDYLADEHIPFVLATNNSTTTVESYIKKLARMGVQATPANIVTSAVATAEYLRHTYGDRPIRVHVLGEAGLFEILLQAGYPAVMMDADVVVAGLDRDLTYGKLRLASTLIRNGARFIGTNADGAFPVPEGLIPGAGSVLAALESGCGQKPFIIGKPEPVMFEMSLARLGVPAEKAFMVGDRYETDIVGAQRVGLRSVLVSSGVSSPETIRGVSNPPDLVLEGLEELLTVWIEARRGL